MDFVSCLRACQTSDVNKAEAALATFAQEPAEYLKQLVACIHSPQLEITTRQLAAVLLREALSSKTDSVYTKLPMEYRISLKTQIPGWILEISDADLRRRVSEILSVYYSALTRDQQTWDELLPWLLQLSQSNDGSLRELSYLCLSRVAALIFNILCSNLVFIKNSLSKALVDPVGEVRLAGVKALTSIVLASPDIKSVKVMRELLQPVLVTIGHLVEALKYSYSESTAMALESILTEIAEIVDGRASFFKPLFGEFLGGMLAIASENGLNRDNRAMAMEIVVLFAEHLPKSLKTSSSNHLNRVLTLLLTLMCDITHPDDWETSNPGDMDVDEDSISFAAERAVDRVALAIGGKQLLPEVLPLVRHLLSLPLWNQRVAALNCMALIGEGCAMDMEMEVLAEMVKLTLSSMNDPHPRVRWFAINTLGQIASDFTPLIQENFHSEAVPVLIERLRDPSVRVRIHTALSLINFAEDAPRDTIEPHMDSLATALFPMLEAPVKLGKEQAVTALAAVAKACGPPFGKFYNDLLPYLMSIVINAADKESITLRGKAIECISLIGLAVGKERFIEDAKVFLGHILQLTQSYKSNPDAEEKLSVYVPSALCRVAQCLGDDFAPFLPVVIPPLLETANKDIRVTKSTVYDVDNLDSEVQEGYSAMLVDNEIVSVYTHDVHEAATAVSLLNSYMSYLKGAYFPFLAKTIEVIGERLNHYTVDLAETSLAACNAIVRVAVAAPHPSPSERAAYVGQVLDFLIPRVLQSLSDSATDSETASCCRALEQMFRAVGSGNLTEAHGGSVVGVILDQLNKLLNSQSTDEDDEPVEAGSLESDEQANLFVALVETLGTIAVGMGENFIQIFSKMWSTFSGMLRVYQPNATAQLEDSKDFDTTDVNVLRIQTSLCLLDDVLDHCGPLMSPIIPEAMPFFLSFMRHPSEHVKQASVYGAGCCVTKHAEATAPYAATILENFKILAKRRKARTKRANGTTDNVASGLLRLATSYPNLISKTEAWSLVWPLLPFKYDIPEVKFVYNLLINDMLGADNSLRIALGEGNEKKGLIRVLTLLASVYLTELVDNETNETIATTLRERNQSLTDEDRRLVWSLLSTTQQTRLNRVLSQK
ncbi:hypothetical protein RCL1_003865 [Eukaryota sp. TZLM3-RCL]